MSSALIAKYGMAAAKGKGRNAKGRPSIDDRPLAKPKLRRKCQAAVLNLSVATATRFEIG
jgi:hypothetical protein